MTAYATAIRRALLAVTRIHRDMGIQARAIKEDGRVDVFDTICRLDLPLVFQELDGLLGAYLKKPAPGVLVTTQRPLSVQRFTAAHELGHHYLGHTPSLDDEDVLRRAPFASQPGHSIQELEANAFAAAFLLPRWLVNLQCARQGWHDDSLHKPEVVYQLALRAGTSYEATCWTLQRYNMIEYSSARHLASMSPRSIKETLLGGLEPENYYGDVWTLTPKDSGLRIEGGPGDHIVLRLPEHSGAGYLWQTDAVATDAFSIIEDTSERINDERIGGEVIRKITARPNGKQAGVLRLLEQRPWDNDEAVNTFFVRYELYGPEEKGLSRAERRERLKAA